MTTLQDLFKAVKDETLNKYQLEGYHKALSEMYSDMQMQLGVVKRARAIYMLNFPGVTGVEIRRNWEGTSEGLSEIELKSYIRATSPILNSLKARLYSLY